MAAGSQGGVRECRHSCSTIGHIPGEHDIQPYLQDSVSFEAFIQRRLQQCSPDEPSDVLRKKPGAKLAPSVCFVAAIAAGHRHHLQHQQQQNNKKVALMLVGQVD